MFRQRPPSAVGVLDDGHTEPDMYIQLPSYLIGPCKIKTTSHLVCRVGCGIFGGSGAILIRLL